MINGKNNIIVFDIDDTLLKTNSPVTKIYKDGRTETLDSDQYAKDPDVDNPDVKWDFSRFNDPDSIYNVMVRGRPLIRNLRVMDRYASEGYTIAFLTARAQEDAIYRALLDVIKIRNKDGSFSPLEKKLSRNASTAVNDKKYDDVFAGLNTPDRKATVLEDLCSQYDNVIFVDDDRKNLKAARQLGLPNLKTITAQREHTELRRTDMTLLERKAFNAGYRSALSEMKIYRGMTQKWQDGYKRKSSKDGYDYPDYLTYFAATEDYAKRFGSEITERDIDPSRFFPIDNEHTVQYENSVGAEFSSFDLGMGPEWSQGLPVYCLLHNLDGYTRVDSDDGETTDEAEREYGVYDKELVKETLLKNVSWIALVDNKTSTYYLGLQVEGIDGEDVATFILPKRISTKLIRDEWSEIDFDAIEDTLLDKFIDYSDSFSEDEIRSIEFGTIDRSPKRLEDYHLTTY